MPSYKSIVLPTYAPLTWLYFSGFVYLFCVFISVFLIMHQFHCFQRWESSLSLNSLSILEEPDNSKTYRQYNQFFEHQQDLFEILSRDIVSLSLSDGKNIQLKPADIRPISHLPFQFWALLITAGICFYIGLWARIFRRRQIEARLLAVSSFCFMSDTCCLAVYSNRELVIEPSQFPVYR